jgi:hypothetical protein
MAPGIPGFRKAMAKQHRKSRSCLRNVHPDAVGLYEMMFEDHFELPLDLEPN